MTSREVIDSGLGLTLWQPWCSAIIAGPKRLENRPWAPGFKQNILGKYIWLHAGLTYDYEAACRVGDLWKEQRPETCPFSFASHLTFHMGKILGRARVVGWIEDQTAQQKATWAGDSAVLVNRKCDEIGAGLEPWWSGPVSWVLEDVRELPSPVVCTGHQKLWKLKKETHEACLAQVEILHG